MCATPSTMSPSSSTPWKPSCLRTSRSQSLPPFGWSSETQTTDQFTATFSGHVRVGAQRPAAGLHDRGDGGGRGQVDQPGDPPGVPALAEQAAGADQHLAVAGLEERGHGRHPVRDGPRPGRASRPGRRPPTSSLPASAGSRRSHEGGERRRVSGEPATVRPVTSSGESSSVRGVGQQRLQRGVRRPRLLRRSLPGARWAGSGTPARGRRAPASGCARRGARARRRRSRRPRRSWPRCGPAPGRPGCGRGGCRAWSARSRPTAARARIRSTTSSSRGSALRARWVQRPVVEERDPVVGVRRAPVLLGQPRAGRQRRAVRGGTGAGPRR